MAVVEVKQMKLLRTFISTVAKLLMTTNLRAA